MNGKCPGWGGLAVLYQIERGVKRVPLKVEYWWIYIQVDIYSGDLCNKQRGSHKGQGGLDSYSNGAW